MATSLHMHYDSLPSLENVDYTTFLHDIQDWMYMINHPATPLGSPDDIQINLDALDTLVPPSTSSATTSTSNSEFTSQYQLCYKEGCFRRARFHSACTLHGGVNSCQIPGCLRKAQRGSFCASHGGSKACVRPTAAELAARLTGVTKAAKAADSVVPMAAESDAAMMVATRESNAATNVRPTAASVSVPSSAVTAQTAVLGYAMGIVGTANVRYKGASD
ncbi:Aste57867_2092 [Aphanomyces stellatus]|uniref:Aste57867_2092 protein n=1 Tax=Aphanomyces stellatus TaxID=120398 RepID=A0A485K6N9_9STRA|nr:hypothetical protein As57867_002087 [Aphanomyces stellatus]VFT79295.1 Aste57867_2092 [Aphanomyces stellatus]